MAMELIAEFTPTTSWTSGSFTNIPQTYKNLYMDYKVAGNENMLQLQFRLNNQTGSTDYRTRSFGRIEGNVYVYGDKTNFFGGEKNQSSNQAPLAGFIEFLDYTQSSRRPFGMGLACHTDSLLAGINHYGSIAFDVASITSIQFIINNASYVFLGGSTIRLWGVL